MVLVGVGALLNACLVFFVLNYSHDIIDHKLCNINYIFKKTQ